MTDWASVKNRQKISGIIELMISRETEVKVRIKGEKTIFTSRIIKLTSPWDQTTTLNAPEEGAEIIMQKLTPDKGNSLIQSSPDVVVECTLGKRSLCFDTRYSGISSNYPYFGIIVAFPESLELKEMRREKRITIVPPEFVSVEFTLKKAAEKDKVYQLNVFDCSRHGLGLLVTDKDFELLQMLNPGDTIKRVTFYAEWAMIRVDATVRHKTKIREGKFKGQYILGVESSDIIENCSPPRS